MNPLASLGLILLFALLAGHLVKYLRVPEVTGYILAGVALGPSALGWITPENLSTLEVFSEVALGLILFSLGSVFEFNHLRAAGRRQIRIVAIESGLAATFVAGGMLVAGQPWQISLLLGSLAIETAAATTLMVLKECNAKGPFTETITGVFALNNILCLVCFMLVATAIDLSRASGPGTGWLVYVSAYHFVWQLAGGAALGFLIGVLLSAWSARVVEHGERLILLAGCILLSVGACHALDLTPMIANLTIGATLVNLSTESRRLFASLSQSDPPLYAIFFVIAGADLNVGMLKTIGVLGAIYVAGRTVGKFGGGFLGARLTKVPLDSPFTLGMGLLAQAGLAVGLTLSLHSRFPDFAPTVVTVVLASVMIYEVVGPLGVRWAIARAGEEMPREPALGLE
jgi:Kef-type K+ transport system membrane component KefB